MEFNPEEFSYEFKKQPSLDLLRRLRKDELTKLAEYANLAVKASMRKTELLQVITDYFVQEGSLEAAELNRSGDKQTALELRKMELEFERQLQERKIQAERELQELKLQAETEWLEKKLEAEKLIELERIKISHQEATVRNESQLLKTASFIPKFSERDVEQFFSCFERTAQTFNWPQEKWTLFLQSALTGKAQRIFAALSEIDAKDYELVKQVVLEGYELVPEAYRQKFRSWKKSNSQSYIEFAKEKEIFFEKWCRSEQVKSWENLSELILIEEFKNCVSPAIKVFLDERTPKSLSECAKLADQFELTHKTKTFKPPSPRKWPNERHQPQGSVSQTFEQPKGAKAASGNHQIKECDHCKKRGHLISECWKLHGKRPNNSQAHTSQANSNKGREQPIALAVDTSCDFGEELSEQADRQIVEVKEALLKEGEEAFCSEGTIASSKNASDQKRIKIWRDSGAFQSLLLEENIIRPEESSLGVKVEIRGIGGRLSVPLHRLHLSSKLFTGEITVGLVKELPIPGIHLLLGNDKVGSKVSQELFSKQISVDDNQGQIFDEKVEDQSPVCQETEGIAVTTRAMSKGSKIIKEETRDKTSFDEFKIEKALLIQEQEKDTELQNIRGELEERDKESEDVYFYLKEGVLMRNWKPAEADNQDDWTEVHQIVLPQVYRKQILSLAHDCPLSGHLGVKKTLYRINKHFFWPKMSKDVAHYCKTCHVCQMSGKPQHVPQKAPLIPISVIEEPFSRIICDCVGPLPKSPAGHEYLFTMMCASTRFPIAIPLRSINAKNVTEALVNFFTLVGLPKKIQTDQGSNFTSKLFEQLTAVLGIRHVCSTAYHPESQGALERFHQTLKSMLRTYCEEHKDWHVGVPLLLFAIRDTVQESLGFSPFELIFGHEPRGPLKLLKEKWLNDSTSQPNLLDYVSKFKERLYNAGQMANENLRKAQEKMKRVFDAKSRERSFSPGDKVLILLPQNNDPLKAKYSGPYQVLEKTSSVNYIIDTPDRRRRRRLCHVNMMKAYYNRENEFAQDCLSGGQEDERVVQIVACATTAGEIEDQETLILPKLRNSEILGQLDNHLSHLEQDKREEARLLIQKFPQIFEDHPSVTDWITHDIDVQENRPVKQHPYRENPRKREIIQKEIEYMSAHNLIEPSQSDWSSPCVLVPKPGGSHRFCTDYRKVNALTVSDSYPLPRIEDCVETAGNATYLTKIDLLKGYYQVPLSEKAKKISAFVTHEGLWQYKVMAFGMKNAGATFQRLANKLIEGLEGCAVYIDDLIIYSDTWSQHLQRLEAVFTRLKAAKLTVNLAKSEIAKSSLNYLGFHLGNGKLRPLEAKIEAVLNFPAPKTRKDLRRFLGMIGFYRKFCPNFSDKVAPLTDLTSPKVIFVWTDECQSAFEEAKRMLMTGPVLAIPTFERPFKIMSDASKLGIGSVLIQSDENGLNHPVAFYSKKFDKHQMAYSTIEKEAFALIDSLKHFAYYLRGGPFPVEVYTDHSPLTFLQKMKNENQRLLRWSLQLQEFDIIIKHVKGKNNQIADCLSRIPNWIETDE